MKVEKPFRPDTGFASWTLFSPDSQTFVFASGLDHHKAFLFDIHTGKVIAILPIMSKKGFDIISDFLKYVERLSFHPSGQILMGANQNLVRFWETQSGRQIKEITEGRDPAVFSRDGKLLVMASSDQKNVLLWEVKM